MKQTFINLGLVERFDKDFKRVEKPECCLYSPELTSRADTCALSVDDCECTAYNNAKEYAVMPSMVEFVMSFRKLDDIGKAPYKDVINKHADVLVQPILLSEFIPSVLVDGVWTVLSEPVKYDKTIHSIEDTREIQEDWDEYIQALDKVKYANVMLDTMDHGKRTVLMLNHGGHGRTIVAELKHGNWQMYHETNEKLVNSLKDNQYLILK